MMDLTEPISSSISSFTSNCILVTYWLVTPARVFPVWELRMFQCLTGVHVRDVHRRYLSFLLSKSLIVLHVDHTCRALSDEAVSYSSGNPRSATNVLLLFLLLEGPRQETHPSLYKRKHMTSKWFVVGDHLTFPFGSTQRCALAFWRKLG